MIDEVTMRHLIAQSQAQAFQRIANMQQIQNLTQGQVLQQQQWQPQIFAEAVAQAEPERDTHDEWRELNDG